MGIPLLLLSNNDLSLHKHQWPVASGGKRWAAGQHGVKCQSHWPSVGLPCVASVVLEVLLVEDELDVGLGVGQTLFLQRLAQLGGAAQEHPNLGPRVL